jgi:hypothetical protein
LAKIKKSEIQLRAKRLLDAFASETRKEALFRRQRKIIRAQCENGLLLLKEDFIQLPPSVHRQMNWTETNLPKTDFCLLSDGNKFSVPGQKNEPCFFEQSPSGKEKIQELLRLVVQMYALQFKIIENVVGILKNEI